LEFVVPEISSSLLRQIIKDKDIDVNEFNKVLNQLRTNDSSIGYSSEYLEGNKVKSDKKGIIDTFKK
jgi:hypothetical protein